MKPPSISSILAAAFLGAVVLIPFHKPETERADFTLEVRMATTTAGLAQVYLDDGGGFRETLTARVPVQAGTDPVPVAFRLPAGTYRAFRFDPVADITIVRVAGVRVLDESNRTVLEIPLTSLEPVHQIASSAIDGGLLVAEATPGANDPQFLIRLQPALLLGASPWAPLRALAVPWLLLTGGIIALVLLAGSSHAVRGSWQRMTEWAAAHPGMTVWMVAGAAAIASSYPVVFLNRSYVSPNFSDGTVLLYNRFPTLPGTNDIVTENARGSDVGAMAWSHVPISMAQHEAMLGHGEWPLWNRYNSAGTILLGQGQSMFGHPVHFVTIAANGAAWAWDFEYVAAKVVLALSIGLIVLALTGHLPSALLAALCAPFIGFFVYRVNHPAFFSFCYAPLILLAWVRVIHARSIRQAVPFAALLVLASWTEMNSGTAKEAYMLLISMNLTGLLLLLMAELPWRARLARLALLAGAGVVFLLVSAPVWTTFLRGLGSAATAYDQPTAFQIHPSLLLGLFDEVFFRPIQQGNRVWNPSANFLVFFSVCYLVATWRGTPGGRMRAAIAGAAFVLFALAFGVVPPTWITRIPFVANIAHVDNTFSCALIILLLVLAGYGWANATARLGSPEARRDLFLTALLVAAVLLPWIALTHTVHKEPFGPGTVFPINRWGQSLPVGDFIWLYLASMLGAGVVLAWIAHRAARRGGWTPAGTILAVTCIILMLWRHGAHARIQPDDYTYNPAARLDLHASSAAIEAVRRDMREPQRVSGLNAVLFPGWSVAYRLEGVNGPDALMNPWFRDLIDACGFDRIWNWRFDIPPESIAALRSCTDMLNIGYFLATTGDAARMPPGLEPIAMADLQVYKSATVWPRAFFTDRVAIGETPAALVDLVRTEAPTPLAAMPAVEAAACGLASSLEGRTVVPAGNYVLTANTTAFDIDAPSRGLVVLHEPWLPGDIRVRIDGRPATCLRVNHAFRAVMIEQPGRHRIEFSFRPKHFNTALALAALGLALAGGGWWWLRRGREA